ncbi:uncharacterized protein LOC130050749 isoform X2 [Ostrea edulis]|uniref:uncharacterized protein LOC130050749 isoform X2 n=1 Tax=Ostrea edulis TaxID=37623 RepID=UPI0024AFF042|nr:uncharacterized protein LOC130050749 isoform X2 [Ostrea edulis]
MTYFGGRSETPHKPGEWVLRMQLKSNTQFEWKWVVICRKTLTILRWEERPNRCTQLQDKIWTCHAPWNHDVNYKLMYNCPVRKMAKKDKGNTESEDIPETGDAPPGRLTALRSVVTWPFRCINRFYQSIAGLVRRDN